MERYNLRDSTWIQIPDYPLVRLSKVGSAKPATEVAQHVHQSARRIIDNGRTYRAVDADVALQAADPRFGPRINSL